MELLILLAIPVLVAVALLRRRRARAGREPAQAMGNEGSRKADI
jgi:hypothetical protein